MLTRRGVDHRGLTFTEKTVVARRVDINYSGPWREQSEVVISGGTRDQRRAALHALVFGSEHKDAGLSVAPYSDRDEYSRA